jgi:twinkle protein
LYGANHFYEEVKKIKENGLDAGVSTGYTGVDEIYRVGPGQMTIITGNPSAGKSEFVDQIMCNVAEAEGWKFALCSFENDPRLHITKLISKRIRSSFWDSKPNDAEFDAAFDWVNTHFSFLHHVDGSLSDLDSILDRLKVAVLRYGIRGAVIDPYNYIMKEKIMSETDWISHMLTRIKTFCTAHDVHVWFVAHPTKPASRGADGKPPIPMGYDISGSAAWWAKADHGLTVHRDSDSPNLSMLLSWKARFPWLGKEGRTMLEYHPKKAIFTEGESLDFDETNITAVGEVEASGSVFGGRWQAA